MRPILKFITTFTVVILISYAVSKFLLGTLFDHIDADVVQRSWSTKEVERVISAEGDTLAVGEAAEALSDSLGATAREVWVR